MATVSKHPVARFLVTLLRFLFFVFAPVAAGLCVIFAVIAYVYFSYNTRNIDMLSGYNEFAEPLRIYTRDNQLLATYGTQQRTIISYDDIPEHLIAACLAAEDSRFFSHHGLDFKSLLRAVIDYFTHSNIKTGASTITMQVSRNFFLTPERTIIRKIKEIFLALKIERELTKKQIFELYVNKIFLGFRSYGFAAAAKTYYNKPLEQLTLAQYAMLASLPKAPSKINPLINKKRALERRNWVLRRMLTLNYIDLPEYDSAVKAPLTAKLSFDNAILNAGYISEWVRLLLLNSPRFLKKTITVADLYRSGYKVYTTIRASLQKRAQQAVVAGLVAREDKIGYRGPEGHLPEVATLTTEEAVAFAVSDALDSKTLAAKRHALWPAIITAIKEEEIIALLEDGTSITLTQESIPYTSRVIPNQETNSYDYSEDTIAEIAPLYQLFAVGDIIRVRQVVDKWLLTQLPDFQAALISLRSETGEIEALIGGFDSTASQFNRATQAKRQIGSTIKPFLYAYALERGMTPATEFIDAPFIEEQGNNDIWRPFNAGGKFLGPIRLRKALYLSRNLVSVRLLHDLGLEATIRRFKALGFTDQQLPTDLSLALGSGVASPIKIARMYALLANGGYPITPSLIQRIEDKNGVIVYQAAPTAQCRDCQQSETVAPVIDPAIDFLINDMLHDVVEKGTARAAKALNRFDIAGKTGTTNNHTDAWFAGFTPDITTVVWVGHDNSYSMGRGASGGSVALPIWMEYMEFALASYPQKPLIKPDDVLELLIDPKAFVLLEENSLDGVVEIFQQGTEPKIIKQNNQFTPSVIGDKIIDAPEDIFN